MQTPLHFKSLTDIATMLDRGEVTSVQITQYMLERINQIDQQFQSYLHLCTDRANAQAEAADKDRAKGIVRGPLHGVPIAVKDLCFTDFAPTTGGTVIHREYQPKFNATVVDRLETAGAVMLGKLTMTEGAYTGHHPAIPKPPNPWSSQHWLGTSSSGSGAATAAGLCYACLGSDTGGSIRYPSASCGLTGVKPTWGRVSRHGVFALAESLDHIGPMARSASDCAVMLQAIAGWDVQDPTSLDVAVPDYFADIGKGVRDMRIGIDRAYAMESVAPPVANALEDALDLFETLGARIVEVTLPPYRELVSIWIPMCAIETAAAHLGTYPEMADQYGPDLKQLIDGGREISGIDVALGHHLRIAFTEAFSTMMQQVDCMLCPTMPMPTPTLEAMASYGSDPGVLNGMMQYTAPFNFSGHPTITLPNGLDDAGMPLSMQIVGPKLGEAAILRAAQAYQMATDWHRRHPDMD